MAQSVEHPASAQVTVSRFAGSSPASGSALTARSLEPASDSVSPPLSRCTSPAHARALSLSSDYPALPCLLLVINDPLYFGQFPEIFSHHRGCVSSRNPSVSTGLVPMTPIDIRSFRITQ